MSLTFTAYFTTYGTPATGLTPDITVLDVSDGSVGVNAQAMTELSLGWYKYVYAGADNTKDYVARADGGAGQPQGERYVPCDSGMVGLVNTINTNLTSLASTSLSNTVWTDAKAGYIDMAISGVAAAVWEVVIENSKKAKHLLSACFAFAKGLVSGATGDGTTLLYRNDADDTDRISTTTDEYGNRTSSSIDVSDIP